MEQDNNRINVIKKFFKFTSEDIIGIIILAFFMFFSFLFLGIFLGIYTPALYIMIIPFDIPQLLNFPVVLSLIFNIAAFLITLYLIYCSFGFLHNSITTIQKMWMRRFAKFIFYLGVVLFFSFPLSIHGFDSRCWSPVGLCDGSYYRMSNMELENAWRSGCNILKNTYNCNKSFVDSLEVVDVTGDGIADSMLTICRAKFNDQTLTKTYCRNKCCNTIIQKGSECEVNADCHFRFGKGDWVCTNNHCCPSGGIWENGGCIEK